MHTLDSGISVAPWINVAPGTFGKNNKHSPLKKHIPLHQITEFWTFLWITLFNKDVAPGKKIQKLINIRVCSFRTVEYANQLINLILSSTLLICKTLYIGVPENYGLWQQRKKVFIYLRSAPALKPQSKCWHITLRSIVSILSNIGDISLTEF